MKNVEETDPRNMRQADVSSFIGPSLHEDSIYKGNLTIIFLLYIFLIYNFQLICPCLAMPEYVTQDLEFLQAWNLEWKSSITIILLSDYFKEDEMIKLSKNLTKCPIWGPFLPK